MKHKASPRFWNCYHALPVDIQHQSDQCFKLMKSDPHHPSIHLKKVGRFWSARIGLYYRALGIDTPEAIVWFWIGSHSEYDRLIA